MAPAVLGQGHVPTWPGPAVASLGPAGGKVGPVIGPVRPAHSHTGHWGQTDQLSLSLQADWLLDYGLTTGLTSGLTSGH